MSANHPWVGHVAIDFPLSLRWLIGRDGSLTARHTIDGVERWWSGCSLPARASAEMLKSTHLTNPVTCFLTPFHAAAIRCNLDMLSREQAVIAIVPRIDDFAVALGCCDFTADLAAHRLWFVAGPDWAKQLEQLMTEQIGLAVPSQFLRLSAADDVIVQRLIESAQIVFSRIVASRSQQIAAMQSPRSRTQARRLCVMTPMRFSLWQDEGFALANAAPSDALHLDTSDPINGSPLKLAERAIEAGILLTPNIARADMPGVIPADIPWLTWITTDRIPSFALAGEEDHLLITDEQVLESARAAGWPDDRIHPAAWPTEHSQTARPSPALAVIADTKSLDAPIELNEFSSHRILWETLRGEIADDPFIVLKCGARDYLKDRLKRFDIASNGFPFDRFVNDLIGPAYAQALVRRAIASIKNVLLYGDGWSDLPGFAPFAAGPVQSRGATKNAIGSATALLHVWPTTFAHPIEACGLPVVRPEQIGSSPRDPSSKSLGESISTLARRLLAAGC
ncbi:MAG: hypothetical protein JO353_02830 [Phycisphaerae bacterium]|nr:hypothetical protein [Phycisphaerae bacterium]